MARCPITGAPATLVQEVGVKLLRGLWQRSFGISTTNLPERGEIGLWRAPCGLAFFDPPCGGGDAFYRALYSRLDAAARLRRGAATRPEYLAAARHIHALARSPGPGVAAALQVLDVGAGPGAFATVMPAAEITAIDPHAESGSGVLRESVSAHAARRGAIYDAVTAFQVIEHVADPLALVRDMLACLKPGGLLVLGAPLWPSPMTAIPNFCLNAPPHHLSWWTAGAMRTLAETLGVAVREVALLPAAPGQPLIHWMGQLTPIRTRPTGPFFAHRWSWHTALATAALLARIVAPWRPIPPTAAPHFVLLVAEKPAR